MKIIKNTLSFALIAAIFAAMLANTALALGSNENILQQANLLQAAEIIDGFDSSISFDDTYVSEIDVIYAAARLTGYNGDFVYNADLPYKKILPGYEHTNVINFAYITKLIDDSDAVSPDSYSTVGFAAKVFTNAAGYGDRARAQKSYVSLSSYKAITNGVQSGRLSAGAFVTMLTNLLDVDFYDVQSYDGGYLNYGTKKGESVAAHYLDLYTVEGVMEKTPYASLTGSYSADGTVVIDGAEYRVNDKSLMLLSCRRVKGIYKKEQSSQKLIYAYADDERIITVDADDFNSYNGSVFKYTDKNGREKSAYTKKGTVVIYNGENITGSGYGSDIFDISEGSVSLIDSGEGYNAVKIESYQNIAVGACSENGDKLTVTDKYDSSKTVTFDTSGYFSVTDENGAEKSVSDIKSGMLITYAASKNGKFANVLLSDNKFVGNVSQIEKSGGRTYVVAEGERYEVTQKFVGSNKLDINGLYIYYINPFGKIGVMRATKNSNALLGYLTDVTESEDLRGKDILTLKILSNDPELDKEITLKTAKRVTIDGKSGLYGEKALQALENFCKSEGKTEFSPTAIVYTTNELGEVNYIDTPYMGEKESGETLVKRHSATDAELMVKNMSTFKAGYTFNLKYYTASDAMHIGYEDTKPDEFYHTSYPNEKKLAVDLYSLGNDTLQCVIAVAKSSASEDKYEDNFALITKVRKTLNSDDDEIYTVNAVYGGKEVTFATRDIAAHPISNIKEGIIVPISLDSKNRLLSAGTAVFDYDNFKKGTAFSGSENYNINRIATARYVTGTVYSVETDEKSGISYIYYYINSPGDLSVLMLRDNINYTVEKLNDGTIKADVLDTAAAADTIKGFKNFGNDADAVVIRYSYWVPSYSFIVKR